MLLSRTEAYSFLNKCMAVEITTTIRNIPVEVSLGSYDGLPKECVANFDNLRTISKQYLSQRISQLPASRVIEVKRAIGYALGWEELIEAS